MKTTETMRRNTLSNLDPNSLNSGTADGFDKMKTRRCGEYLSVAQPVERDYQPASKFRDLATACLLMGELKAKLTMLEAMLYQNSETAGSEVFQVKGTDEIEEATEQIDRMTSDESESMPSIADAMTKTQLEAAEEGCSKSPVLTFVLWLTLGWFGAHHFYLGRYRHGFVWLATLGGGFGFGWLAEIWRLPAYVRAANNGGRSVRCPTEEGPRPSVAWERLIGELIFSFYAAALNARMSAFVLESSGLSNVFVANSLPYRHPLRLCVGTFAVAAGEIGCF